MISLTPKQIEYTESATHRWNIKTGAVRSGKSFVDTAAVVPKRIIERKGRSGLSVIIGVSKSTIERNVLQPMREIYGPKRIGSIVSSTNTARVFGEDVYCLGAEKISQVAKIQGASIKYCYGDEIARWNKDVFIMLQSRLDKPYSCFDGACNPESPGHWLKKFLDSDADLYLQKYTIFDNPYLPKDFVSGLCNEYAGTVYYERYIRGNWALAEGLIYPMYEEAVVDMVPQSDADEYCVSVDYGTMNAFAALLWTRYGNVWIAVEEYYHSGRDTGMQKTDDDYVHDLIDFCQPVKDWETRQKVKGRMFEDYQIDVIIDPSAASFITAIRRVPMFHVIKGNNDVLDGIRMTASAIKTGKIKVAAGLENWKEEAMGYVWDEKREEDSPVKIKDHLMDSMRYFVRTKQIADEPEEYNPIWNR